MLMFITHPSDRYSIAEEVQMVLEGGCKWIQLRIKDISDEEFRQTALEIIPLCKENEAFLVFDDRVELAMEMGVHGVHLGKNDMNPLQARETMGADNRSDSQYCRRYTPIERMGCRLCGSRSFPLHYNKEKSVTITRTRRLPRSGQ